MGDHFTRLLPALPQDGPDAQPFGWFVPGRLEVLGKHTDYAGGRSLVCAVERGIHMLVRPRVDDRVRLIDAAQSTVFNANLADTSTATAHGWFIYPSTVLRRVTQNFPAATRGFDAVFDSDLPQAGGLSSSSALMIAVFLAFARVNGLETTEIWRAELANREDLAGYAASLENGRSFGSLEGDRGVGTSGGSEDHVAILCCRAGTLSQYAFNPIRCEAHVPLADHLTFAVAVSGVGAHKTGNAMAQYNRAARLAGRALEHWNSRMQRTDTSLAAALRESGSHAVRDVLSRAGDAEFTADELRERFDQFAEESEHLVPVAARQVQSGDWAGFCETVARSQHLAEQALRNQVPETSALVSSARATGAVAASAFGAGFGGSVWALVNRDDAVGFLKRWANAYEQAFPGRMASSTFFLTRPGAAAFDVTPGPAKAGHYTRG